MIAVTFAVAHESRPFRRALSGLSRADFPGAWRGHLGALEVLVVHTGIGPVAAAASTEALLARHRPSWLLSAGYAGALDPQLGVGEIVVARNFSAPALLESCRQLSGSAPSFQLGDLTTQAQAAANPMAKAALAIQTGAQAVDMETGAISLVAAAHGLPILSVRAISDRADQALPVPLETSYNVASQRARPVALLTYLARHPSRIAPFARFLADLKTARCALSNFLVALLQESGPSRN